MLQDVFHPPEQLPIDDISSPLSDQIFDFCDPDLFSDTLQNSEVTSSSNCCYEDNSSYTPTDNNNNPNNPTFPTDLEKLNQDSNNNNNNSTTTTATSTTTTATNATATTNNNNLSIIFDSQDEIENDISASIDFSSSPTFSIPQFLSTQQYPFDFASTSSSMQPQPPNPNHPIQIPSPLTDQTVVLDGSVLSSLSQFPVDPVPPLLGPTVVTASAAATLPSVFEDDCLSSVPAYVAPNLNPSSPSCSFLGPGMATSYMPGTGTMTGVMPADGAGIFTGGILTGSSELPPQELDFQGDNAGIFSCAPDSMQRVFNTGDLQKALSGDSQQLVGAVSSSAPITSEISSLDDSTFKVGKLSVEQRKEKIHRYMKKRNERNFSKKIKYACRKTLADSRPRVRGRFAKNDDFGETHRTTCSNHEEDDDEEVVVKEEEDLVDSDIFAHISGVNSFKCNYPIQSWI